MAGQVHYHRSDSRPEIPQNGEQPVLVVNKMDDPEDDYFFEDFKRLGFSKGGPVCGTWVWSGEINLSV